MFNMTKEMQAWKDELCLKGGCRLVETRYLQTGIILVLKRTIMDCAEQLIILEGRATVNPIAHYLSNRLAKPSYFMSFYAAYTNSWNGTMDCPITGNMFDNTPKQLIQMLDGLELVEPELSSVIRISRSGYKLDDLYCEDSNCNKTVSFDDTAALDVLKEKARAILADYERNESKRT